MFTIAKVLILLVLAQVAMAAEHLPSEIRFETEFQTPNKNFSMKSVLEFGLKEITLTSSGHGSALFFNASNTLLNFNNKAIIDTKIHMLELEVVDGGIYVFHNQKQEIKVILGLENGSWKLKELITRGFPHIPGDITLIKGAAPSKFVAPSTHLEDPAPGITRCQKSWLQRLASLFKR